MAARRGSTGGSAAKTLDEDGPVPVEGDAGDAGRVLAVSPGQAGDIGFDLLDGVSGRPVAQRGAEGAGPLVLENAAGEDRRGPAGIRV